MAPTPADPVSALRMFGRYAKGMRGYLRTPIRAGEAGREIQRLREARAGAFLRVLERGVYGSPDSPYRALLVHAGVEHSDVAALVAERGVEGALEVLYDAGCRVSLDEFKGRKPIERGSLRLEVRPEDFDNPLLVKHYEARTSGSRGVGRRLAVDLDMLAHEALHHAAFQDTMGIRDRPFGLWRPLPPTGSGIKNLLLQLKSGRPLDRWFTPTPLHATGGGPKAVFFLATTFAATRAWSSGMPVPRHQPIGEARPVAEWLAACRAAGRPAMLDATVSSSIRVCLAARDLGLDISDTFFRVGGEPLTATRAEIFASAGARVGCHYSVSEIGRLGIWCPEGEAIDDVHLVEDKIAVLQRPQTVAGGERTVDALVFTTLVPSVPKLALNVEVDDYGVLERRPCGCVLHAAGNDLHLHTIRSHEKLTSEGTTFMGEDLVVLVDELLPRRFGGSPTDWQLVEEEENGLPRVTIVARPELGPLDENEVLAAVLSHFETGSDHGNRAAAGLWRDGGTLRVARREPYRTVTSKVLPLHVVR